MVVGHVRDVYFTTHLLYNNERGCKENALRFNRAFLLKSYYRFRVKSTAFELLDKESRVPLFLIDYVLESCHT